MNFATHDKPENNEPTSVKPGVIAVKLPITSSPKYLAVNSAASSPVGSSIPNYKFFPSGVK